jgi:hypothetical protein
MPANQQEKRGHPAEYLRCASMRPLPLLAKSFTYPFPKSTSLFFAADVSHRPTEKSDPRRLH